MTLDHHTTIRLSTKFCMTTTNGMPNGTMKLNTLFTFLVPHQIQACVKAVPLPQVQPNVVRTKLLWQVQPNFIQARSSHKISLDMVATTFLDGKMVHKDMVGNAL